MLVYAQGGDFGDGVGAMDFDATEIEPPRHGLTRLFNEAADIFDLPGGGAGPKFYRLGKSTGLYAGPPSRSPDGDWSVRRENGSKANKTKRWQVSRRFHESEPSFIGCIHLLLDLKKRVNTRQ